MKTIVSVTPLAVEADSRTFKEAASFARLGYRSIVVEVGHSTLPRQSLPFELISTAVAPKAQPHAAPRAQRTGIAGLALAALRRVYGPLRWLRATLRDRRSVAPLLPPASLYYLHEFSQYPSVRSACRRHRSGYVYEAHDLYSALISEQRLQPGFSRSAHWMRGWLERACVRGAAACVTVAPRLAQLQQRRFGRRFEVVRNAHDDRIDEPAAKSIREVAGVGADTLLAVVIGNAKPAIAFPRTLEAIAALPASADVHLACIGRGYERFADEVAGLGLERRVSFVGATAPTGVVSFARGADLALTLYTATNVSVHNALPNGFFQAVAAHLPMLYAPLPEIAALARRYGLGVEVDPGDPRAVAAAIARLADDRSALRSFRAAAERAAPELSWEHEEPHLARIVAAALEER